MSQYRVLVLASGSGTLFQALLDNEEKIGIQIVGLISDAQVGAVRRALDAEVECHIIPRVVTDWDERMCERITHFAPDLIVSAGFMRIIGPITLAKFQGRIINTHPALLPEFPGAHAVRDALAAHVDVTGTTIHFIDAGVDTGEIIEQREVPVMDSDDEGSLHARIKAVERELLVETVAKFARGELQVKA